MAFSKTSKFFVCGKVGGKFKFSSMVSFVSNVCVNWVLLLDMIVCKKHGNHSETIFADFNSNVVRKILWKPLRNKKHGKNSILIK